MTAQNSTNQDSDAVLLAMVRRHDELWAEWDLIAAVDENDVRIDTLSRESCDLELRIIATRARTTAGREAKLHVLRESGFIGDAQGNPPTGDLEELVAMILQLDREAVAGRGVLD